MSAAAAQLFPLQGLIRFQVVVMWGCRTCPLGLHHQMWSLVQLTDSLRALSAPGALEQCTGSTQWFTPLEKQDHLRIFWSRQVQISREDHVPSRQQLGVTLPKAISAAFPLPAASTACLSYRCHSKCWVNTRIVSAGWSQSPPNCLLKILAHCKEMTVCLR